MAKPYFPPLSKGHARVVFYRADGSGPLLRPDIHLNGEIVGEAAYGQYFFRDVTPGHYTVTIRTENTSDVAFDLKAGDEQFVRFMGSQGILLRHVYPEVVKADVAADELEHLNYAGSDVAAITEKLTEKIAEKMVEPAAPTTQREPAADRH
ncbi:MAG TPA: DUF2846 domain-containing protein [Bdellovibrionota bacterium]|nr:DUF2846 domain-containing protein [Bdellovibrionota bacterium]